MDKKRLCPNCGGYLDFVPAGLGKAEHYVCPKCGYRSDGKDVAINLDSTQRFPTGMDSSPSSPLDSFMKGKKQ